MKSVEISGWAATKPKQPLTLHHDRVSVGPHDVVIRVESCGICHSDIHLIDDDWGISSYPFIPGHEIVGRVEMVGEMVKRVHVGARVGVGWQATSCGHCSLCDSHRENMCTSRGATCVRHHGGYADRHVAHERFCFVLPESLSSSGAAPLFCGGATVYSPLVRYSRGARPGSYRVGILGLGGLGHLGLKFARSMGFEAVALTSSASKVDELKHMGAHDVVVTSSRDQLKRVTGSLDLVLSTVNVDQDWNALFQTVGPDGTFCFLGIPPSEVRFSPGVLMGSRRQLTASPIASPSEISDMLLFAARHRIEAQINTFKLSDVNEALDFVRAGKPRFRAVLESG